MILQVTFDKTAKQFVYNSLRSLIKNRNCLACNEPVTARNFGGAVNTDEYGMRYIHKNFICLLQVSKELPK